MNEISEPAERADADAREARIDQLRRRVIAGLAAGAFLVPGTQLAAGCASTVGRRPQPLPADRSVWRAEGSFKSAAEAAPSERLPKLAASIVADRRLGALKSDVAAILKGGGLKMEFEPHLPETSCTVRMTWQTQ